MAVFAFAAAGGVVASALIAWGLSLVPHPVAFATQPNDSADSLTRSFLASLPSDERWHLQDWRQVACRPGSTLIRHRASAIGPNGVSACRHVDGAVARYGWPLPAMQYEVRRLIPGPSPRPGDSRTPALSGGWPVATPAAASWFPQAGVVPVRPVWSGLIVDGAIFGIMLGALCLLPQGVRRHVRARGGRCVACGYPAAAAACCPECGHPYPPR